MAWDQFYTARRLSRVINGLARKNLKHTSGDVEMQHLQPGLDSYNAGGTSGEQDEWGLPKGFFAVMGGFAFDSSSISKSYSRLTLTASGVIFLAKRGHILRTSKDLIEDKSKANFLAKGLSVLQASWMVIQCIARKQEHLPLSLLEVHTLVHVICAVAMYGFWLRKPLDVQDPTLLDFNKHGELLALMTMLSPSLTTPHGERSSLSEAQLLRYEGPAAQTDRRSPSEPFRSVTPPSHGPESVKITSHQEKVQIPHLTMRRDGETFTLRHNQIDIETGFGPNFGPKTQSGQQPRTMPLAWQDAERWRLASRALKAFPELLSDLPFATENSKPVYGVESLEDQAKEYSLVLKAPPNLQATDREERKMIFAVFVGLGAVYGGVHASVSDDIFPSHIESDLWYAASLFIATSGPILVMALRTHFYYLEKEMQTPWSVRFWCKEWRVKDILWKFVLLLQFAVVLLYSASRLFIIVESLISLPRLPVGAFQMVTWTNYFIHF